MLTHARSLFTRIFSWDISSSRKCLTTSSSNDFDDQITNTVNDIDDQSSLSERKSKEQINEYSNNPPNLRYIRPHEKSKQDRLIQSMQIAISRCNIQSMKNLLNNINIDINHRDQYGMSYLEHAILIGNFDMVDLLIRYGCDLNQVNSTGHSYLYVAIETTTNKSLAIVRLLLESNCSCLYSMDLISLTSPKQIIYINCQDFLTLNEYLLPILKYHIDRMLLNDVLNLLNYFIITNLLLCKNNKYYELNTPIKLRLQQFNDDYICLLFKILGNRHGLKLKDKLQNLQPFLIPPLMPITDIDIHPHVNRMVDLSKNVFELKHLCRGLIRKKLRNLKTSTIAFVVPTVKLQDYLLYMPI